MPLTGYNFTERVRKVLALARDDALSRRHEYVGTEHLLIAVARETEGVSAAVLASFDVKGDSIIDRVEFVIQRGSSARTSGDLPYTSRAKKVLELAMNEARIMGHTYVGTEHLLLGIIAEEKGIGAQVLVDAGVTLEKARAETIALLGKGAVPGAADMLAAPAAALGYARSRTPYGVALVEDFTGRARDALRGAYQEAASRDHLSVDLSHVLLALASREDGMAAVLLDQVVGSRKLVVEALVERLPDREKDGSDQRTLQLSPETQHALDNALLEASKDGHRRAGTQHILLAVLDILPLALAAACAQLGLTAKAARVVYERMRE